MNAPAKYREIPLTRGQVAIVDAADYEWLAQWKWYAVFVPDVGSFYATRNVRVADGTQRQIRMHRQILGLGFGDRRKGDHIDPSKTLDNRRHNLRVSTNAENCRNRRTHSTNKSGYKGVSWHKASGKWRPQICINGKRQNLGGFDNPTEAYAAYCAAARRLHGEFARFA